MSENSSWTNGKNGPKGLGKAGGKSKGGYGQNQGKARYNRKRITKNYGGGK